MPLFDDRPFVKAVFVVQTMTSYAGLLILASGICTFDVAHEARAQSSAPAEHSPSQIAEQSTWALRDSEAAIAQARRVLGLESPPGNLAISAELVTLAKDNTPFLSDKIIGRPVWRVVLTGWGSWVKVAPPHVKDSFDRTWDILLDPETGQLLKIMSRWPTGVEPIRPEAGAEAATQQFRESGSETYHGFPTENPRIDFSEAVSGVVRSTGKNPLLAKQIKAQYVLWSLMGKEPKPVWAITLRGIRSSWVIRRGGPRDAIFSMRYIIDAETGKFLTASNTPRPERPSAEDDD